MIRYLQIVCYQLVLSYLRILVNSMHNPVIRQYFSILHITIRSGFRFNKVSFNIKYNH